MGNEVGELERRAKDAVSLILPNSIYFAHPINYYVGSKLNVHGNLENVLVEMISRELPGFNVYNPNQKHNEENYFIWRQEAGNGMKYYFDVILPEMKAGVYLPFSDGMIGKGVYGEVENLLENDKPVWEISESGILTPIKYLDESRMLSVEETKDRVYPKA